MKRFQFELEPVLRHKARLEREAEARVTQAVLALQEAQEELARRTAELERLAEEISRLGPQPAAVWSERFDRVALLGESVKQAEQAVADAHAQLDQAMRERARIGMQAESLRQLKFQRWQEYKRQRDRSRQKEQDDDVLRRRNAGSDFGD